MSSLIGKSITNIVFDEMNDWECEVFMDMEGDCMNEIKKLVADDTVTIDYNRSEEANLFPIDGCHEADPFIQKLQISGEYGKFSYKTNSSFKNLSPKRVSKRRNKKRLAGKSKINNRRK